MRLDSRFDRNLFLILIAFEILMSFTFLGYIHIPPISITIAYIPILVAGCLLKPFHAMFISFIFGLASVLKASASHVMPLDKAFSPFATGFVVDSLLLSVGTRMLFGLIIGLAFLLARRSKHYALWTGIISAFALKVHSLIVYTAMGILFPWLGSNYHSALRWKQSDFFFIIICVAIVEFLLAAYKSSVMQRIKNGIDKSVKIKRVSKKVFISFASGEFVLVFISLLATIYFLHRMTDLLEYHGVPVDSVMQSDIMIMHVQFFMALLSLNAIVVMTLVSTYRYMSYKEYYGGFDVLTGVMGRKMFLQYCKESQQINASGDRSMGWFLFIDADYFKSINDTLGHSVGDKVLRDIAINLRLILKDDGVVGRLGGDEFAAIIESPMTEQELSERLDRFLTLIADILPDRTVSCSIGAYQFVFPQKLETLLEEADRVLYESKDNGRACYVMKPAV